MHSTEDLKYDKIAKEYIFSDKLSTKNKLRLIVGSVFNDGADISVIDHNNYIVVGRLKNISNILRIFDKTKKVIKLELNLSSVVTSKHLDATRIFNRNNMLGDKSYFFMDDAGEMIFDNIDNLTNIDLYKIYLYIKLIKK